MSVKDPGKKNLFFVVTCGEDYTFETLNAIREHAMLDNYKIQIWYAIDKLDQSFYEKLLTYTDDVIVANKKYPFSACQSYAMIYSDYDYLWVMSPDAKPLPGFVDKVEHGFNVVPYVVCVGNPKFKTEKDFSISHLGSLPDLLQVFDHKMVNMFGALNPCFRYNGHEIREIAARIIYSRFNFVSVQGMVEELGYTNPNIYKIQKEYSKENWDVLLKCSWFMNNNRPYNWWSDNIMQADKEQYESTLAVK